MARYHYRWYDGRVHCGSVKHRPGVRLSVCLSVCFVLRILEQTRQRQQERVPDDGVSVEYTCLRYNELQWSASTSIQGKIVKTAETGRLASVVIVDQRHNDAEWLFMMTAGSNEYGARSRRFYRAACIF